MRTWIEPKNSSAMGKPKIWGESKTIDAINTPSSRQKETKRAIETPEETNMVLPVILAKTNKVVVKKPMQPWMKSIIAVVVVLAIAGAAVLIIALVRGKLVKNARKKGKNTIDVSTLEEDTSPGMIDDKYRILPKGGDDTFVVKVNREGKETQNPKTPSYNQFPTATDVVRLSPKPVVIEPEEAQIEEPQPEEINGDVDEEQPIQQEEEEQHESF